mmetsp:Transcript_45817/g.106457  ORF Transcript_45817/g.106457 Transcript_45817/m.106457 type:complete len:168 (-) Transcript_45817:104-607(-)
MFHSLFSCAQWQPQVTEHIRPQTQRDRAYASAARVEWDMDDCGQVPNERDELAEEASPVDKPQIVARLSQVGWVPVLDKSAIEDPIGHHRLVSNASTATVSTWTSSAYSVEALDEWSSELGPGPHGGAMPKNIAYFAEACEQRNRRRPKPADLHMEVVWRTSAEARW